MSMKNTTAKPQAEATDAIQVVVQIADIVIAHRMAEKATLAAVARVASRSAGLLAFKSKAERTAAENAAAVQIAKRLSLI